MLTLFGYLINQFFEKKKKRIGGQPSHNKELQVRLMNYSALCAIFINGLYNLLRFPVSFGIRSLGNCGFQSGFLAAIWATARLCTYCFFVSRLDVAFRYSSEYRIPRSGFAALYGLIVFSFVAEMIIIIIFWAGEFVDIEGTLYCATAAPEWTYGYLSSWDFIISATTAFLFVSKLWKVQSHRSSVDAKAISMFWTNVSKYMTLSIVGVLTTWATILTVKLLGWIILVAIDTSVNSWCVFLAYGANRKTFDRMCKYCVCVGTSCLLYFSSIQLISAKDLKMKARTLTGGDKPGVQEIVVWSIENSQKPEHTGSNANTVVSDMAYTAYKPANDLSPVGNDEAQRPEKNSQM